MLTAFANIRLAVTIFIGKSLRYIADVQTACNRMQQFIENTPIDSISMNHNETNCTFI